MSVCGIIVAAGAGTRLGGETNKVLLPLKGRPLLVYAVEALRPFCRHLILVVRPEEEAEISALLKNEGLVVDTLVHGGKERRHSVENALNALPMDAELVLVHDAARPFPGARLIEDIMKAAREHGAAVPALPVNDTLRSAEGRTVPRAGLYTVQTPQGFRKDILLRAYRECEEALTDDAGLVERLGLPVQLVPGEARNLKITRKEDLGMADACLRGQTRVGTGFDVHRLVEDRDLILCGVLMPHKTGLLGHSDADVALHALTDALLGACALGDIGTHFPDSKAEYQGASSITLLEESACIMKRHGFVPWQCDLTILAQAPKLAPFVPKMRENIANALNLPLERVSVKATTTEGLGFEGRGEGISAQAVAMVLQLP